VKQIAAFCALSGDDRRLLARALALNARTRLALYFRSLEKLRGWAGQPGDGRRPLERIVWAGRAAARRMPGATCLSSALALQRLLAGNGYDSELHIGVTRNAGAFFAHAWVEYEGRILIGEDDGRSYTRLASWTIAPSMLGSEHVDKTDAG
jgi:hypothetical protein